LNFLEVPTSITGIQIWLPVSTETASKKCPNRKYQKNRWVEFPANRRFVPTLS